MRFAAEMLRHKDLGFPWNFQHVVKKWEYGDDTTRSKPSLHIIRAQWGD